MSWQKIRLPLTMEIDPITVEIGKIVWDRYQKENKPEGFAMFHATEGSEDGMDDKRIIYFSPVAAKLSNDLIASYNPEPCEAPYNDEPNMAFVFGDPHVMGDLRRDYYARDSESATVSETATTVAEA